MQIYARSILVYQLLIFCVFSPYFLHVADSLVEGFSALDQIKLYSFLTNRLSVLILAAVALVCVWRLSAYAKYVMLALVLNCLGVALYVALKDLNKIVLILCFIYAVTAYYLLMLYNIEIESAAYNPLYSSQTIGRRSDYKLGCSLISGGNKYQGYLTNWDERGCFVSLEPGEANLVELHGEIEIEVLLDGHLFKQNAYIVSSYLQGVGIRFTMQTQAQQEDYNWLSYYRIIDDRGYFPRSRNA